MIERTSTDSLLLTSIAEVRAAIAGLQTTGENVAFLRKLIEAAGVYDEYAGQCREPFTALMLTGDPLDRRDVVAGLQTVAEREPGEVDDLLLRSVHGLLVELGVESHVDELAG